jgi:hypothetical protein
MSLPATVRVKLSSEDAGAISLTPVVVREMPIRELVEFTLASAGKRTERILEILQHGQLVSGASRLRWQGWEADADEIDALLAAFPDPEPARPFDESRCVLAVLWGPYVRIGLPREPISKRRMFRRSSLWDHLAALAQSKDLRYIDYSYRDRADCYRLALDYARATAIRASAPLLRYAALARQIETAAFDSLDFFVRR